MLVEIENKEIVNNNIKRIAIGYSASLNAVLYSIPKGRVFNGTLFSKSSSSTNASGTLYVNGVSVIMTDGYGTSMDRINNITLFEGDIVSGICFTSTISIFGIESNA